MPQAVRSAAIPRLRRHERRWRRSALPQAVRSAAIPRLRRHERRWRRSALPQAVRSPAIPRLRQHDRRWRRSALHAACQAFCVLRRCSIAQCRSILALDASSAAPGAKLSASWRKEAPFAIGLLVVVVPGWALARGARRSDRCRCGGSPSSGTPTTLGLLWRRRWASLRVGGRLRGRSGYQPPPCLALLFRPSQPPMLRWRWWGLGRQGRMENGTRMGDRG